MNIIELSRRKFLALSSVLASTTPENAPSIIPRSLGLIHSPRHGGGAASPTEATQGYKVLSPHEVTTLEAMVDVIVPEDEHAGARWAGVVHYIDNALAGDHRHRLAIYRAGIEATNEASQLEYGRQFAKVSFEQQTALLKQIEQAEAPGTLWQMVSQEKFLRLLWIHTLEGYYGPPQYGGNKNCVSWRMVGYPGPSVWS